MLSIPKMDISTPGNGVMAKGGGKITLVTETLIKVGEKEYSIVPRPPEVQEELDEFHIFPVKEMWQIPVVKVGQEVKKKELLAKGETHIMFQANVWIFAILAIIIGSIWGIGKAGVYKHIPDYFPDEIGVVGGMVGLLGGLGGFFGPVIFGYLLEATGLWTTCWMFMLLLSALCLWWMHRVIQKMMYKEVPELMREIETKN